MANTNRNNVLLIAPELSGVSQDLITLVLADVAIEVGTIFGRKQEQAQRYLAAHYLTLSNPCNVSRNPNVSGPISQMKTGDESVSYGGGKVKNPSRYDETSYGRMFESIKRTCVHPAVFVNPT
jgi:hypothetical protein